MSGKLLTSAYELVYPLGLSDPPQTPQRSPLHRPDIPTVVIML